MLYSAYLLPEEIPKMGERKPHHSKYELIRTDDSCKEFLVNIVKKVNVLRQQDFKSKFPKGGLRTDATLLLQDSISRNDVSAQNDLPEPYRSSDYFFFRQRFMKNKTETGGSLLPELKPICVCQKIANLDEETLECPSCKAAFHPDCMR